MRWAPQRLQVPAGHGHLEALLQQAPSPPAAAVVCHPHPLYGGTMDNNVVYRIARALHAAGLTALRFNFRGVGGSTGRYSEGIGEEEDVAAALDFLAQRHPGVPLWVAGFSFGSRVGLSAGARDPRVQKLLGSGLALAAFDFSFLHRCQKPKAFVHGERDEFGGADQVRALVAQMPEPKHLEVIAGAKHLFTGKLPELESALERAAAFLAAC
jgi:alpha/beta superfamily hydrolase